MILINLQISYGLSQKKWFLSLKIVYWVITTYYHLLQLKCFVHQTVSTPDYISWKFDISPTNSLEAVLRQTSKFVRSVTLLVWQMKTYTNFKCSAFNVARIHRAVHTQNSSPEWLCPFQKIPKAIYVEVSLPCDMKAYNVSSAILANFKLDIIPGLFSM